MLLKRNNDVMKCIIYFYNEDSGGIYFKFVCMLIFYFL